jgi:transcriptional regulator with XRE-family HTH domain
MEVSPCDLAEISARLRAAREAIGKGQAEFSRENGLSPGTYRKNENGVTEAGICLAGVFIRAGINANWLLTGEGPMLLKDLPDLVELAALRARPEQPPPAEIDQALLATTIEGILRARPDASPAQVAAMAVEFYVRVLAMDMAKPKAA